MHEDLPVVDQIKSILEWHFDELVGLELGAIGKDLGVEPNLISKFDPHIVFITELLVIHIALISEDLKDIMRLIRGKSMVKEPGLLSGEPFSELVVSAVSESADEMGDLVVRHGLLQVLRWDPVEVTPHVLSLVHGIVDSLDVQLVLP